jgi:UDP-N-acetylmuramoyl-tripeptide--D-alanyl-D-alanine ligase
MIELATEEIAAACAGRIVADPAGGAGGQPVRAIVDSRLTAPNDLFFGIAGEHTDGGAFAERAIESGAWGVVVSAEHAARLSDAGALGARVIAVADPATALAGLARRWARELAARGARTVGITGSVGKTSTKDILVSLLRPAHGDRLHANRENYNTEIGLPLTLLEAPGDARVLVLEMAMRGMGQIRELAQIARPEVGVITNVGPVHLELVGTIERVAEAKAELIAELPNGGTCVVPAAEEALRPHLRSDIRVLTFAAPGTEGVESIAGAAADVRVLGVEELPGALRAEVTAGPEHRTIELGFTQMHNLPNALAAIGAGHALGHSLEEMAEGASKISFSSLRGEQLELAGALIINDCYNANPISMRAALEHLAAVADARDAQRRIAVLGDMKELGEGEQAFHREAGRQAAYAGVDVLIAVGDLAEAYAEGYGAGGEVHLARDSRAAADTFRELVAAGDVVLVKGSRSVGLERVAQALDPVSDGAG